MLSVIGLQVVPAFVVFHTPPEPTATYQVFSFSRSMAMSAILPDINAGPILLNLKPLRAALTDTFSSFLSWALALLKEKIKENKTANSARFFMGLFCLFEISSP